MVLKYPSRSRAYSYFQALTRISSEIPSILPQVYPSRYNSIIKRTKIVGKETGRPGPQRIESPLSLSTEPQKKPFETEGLSSTSVGLDVERPPKDSPAQPCHFCANNKVIKTHPVSLVVQIVVDDDGDDASAPDGDDARLRFRFWLCIRVAGRTGRRTLPTHAVAGPAITTTQGPHRGDRRDRQLRQDGGDDFRLAARRASRRSLSILASNLAYLRLLDSFARRDWRDDARGGRWCVI
ncbi:hypothetical protein KM043_009267 [Ampulex compressa]|nr:hypothetical protein KM043_009267 [Ampulex compressa]